MGINAEKIGKLHYLCNVYQLVRNGKTGSGLTSRSDWMGLDC